MADSVHTLRPNSLTGAGVTGTWTPHGGAPTVVNAVDDDTDVTYNTTSDNSGLPLNLSTFTLPALAVVKSFTLRARLSDADMGAAFMSLEDDTNGRLYGAYSINVVDSAIGTYTFGTFTPLDMINQTAIDGLIVWNQGNTSSAQAWYEVYVDVNYNQAPVVSAVTIDSATNPTPKVSFVYSDPEGDLQERLRVKIFSAAQYGAGGFDPETSTATYDSGEVFSSATSYLTTGAVLANATVYKAYVKTADVGSSGRYGSWVASGTWTASLTIPTVPSILSTFVHADTGHITIIIQGTGGSDTYLLERCNDGINYVQVRTNAANWTYSGGLDQATFQDFEAIPGTVLYRARARNVEAGSYIYSAYTSPTTVTYTLNDWFLSDVLNPISTVYKLGMQPTHSITTDEQLGVFTALGRTRKVVVGDVVTGDDGKLDLYSLIDWTGLKTLYYSQKTLFLVSPDGEGWYIRFTKRSRQRVWVGSYARPFRKTTLEYVAVDVPA